MPQGTKYPNQSRATTSLNDSNPRTLLDNMTIVMRDGGVYLQTRVDEDVHERRIDSAGDADTRQRGNLVWYDALLEQQRAREAKNKPAPKSKGEKS